MSRELPSEPPSSRKGAPSGPVVRWNSVIAVTASLYHLASLSAERRRRSVALSWFWVVRADPSRPGGQEASTQRIFLHCEGGCGPFGVHSPEGVDAPCSNASRTRPAA